MKITEIKVFPVQEEKLKAFVSVVLDECFMVNDIKVINGRDGYFISMPSRRKKNGKFKDVAHPLNNETRRMMEESILGEYEKVVADTAHTAASAVEPSPQRSESPPPPVAAPLHYEPAAPQVAPPEVHAELQMQEARTANPESQPASEAREAPTADNNMPGDPEKSLEEVTELHLGDNFWNN